MERWPIDRLTPYARNARTHSDAQVAQIAASIREWGWTTPVLVDEQGGLIAGHGRVLAARQLGIDTVPVMVARGWTDAQRRAYVLADNKLALNAGWDDDLLRVELADLSMEGFDITLAGFEPEEEGGGPGGIPSHEVDVSETADVFFVTVSGPLRMQAEALQRVKALMGELPEVTVDLGMVERGLL